MSTMPLASRATRRAAVGASVDEVAAVAVVVSTVEAVEVVVVVVDLIVEADVVVAVVAPQTAGDSGTSKERR